MFKFIQNYIDKKVEAVVNKRLDLTAEKLIINRIDEEYDIGEAIGEVVADQVESELRHYMDHHLEEVVEGMCDDHVKRELDFIEIKDRVDSVIEDYVYDDLGYQGKLLDLFKEVVAKLEANKEKGNK